MELPTGLVARLHSGSAREQNQEPMSARIHDQKVLSATLHLLLCNSSVELIWGQVILLNSEVDAVPSRERLTGRLVDGPRP